MSGNSRRRGWRGRFVKNLAPTPEDACVWLIWSHYWRAWHRKSSVGGACGYTDDIAEAGLFPRSMAVAYHDGDRDEPYLVSEKTPLIEAAIAKHVQKLANLRAALASVDTLPKGHDGEAGVVRSKGSAVAAKPTDAQKAEP